MAGNYNKKRIPVKNSDIRLLSRVIYLGNSSLSVLLLNFKFFTGFQEVQKVMCLYNQFVYMCIVCYYWIVLFQN